MLKFVIVSFVTYYEQLSAGCLIELYCIVLYCIVLYCIVLYCIVLYCIVLYYTVLYCIVLYCIVLYCIFYFPRVALCHDPTIYMKQTFPYTRRVDGYLTVVVEKDKDAVHACVIDKRPPQSPVRYYMYRRVIIKAPMVVRLRSRLGMARKAKILT